MCTALLVLPYAAILLQSYAPFNNFLFGPYLAYYLTNSFDTYMVFSCIMQMCTVALILRSFILLKSYAPCKYFVMIFCQVHISFTIQPTPSILTLCVPYSSQMCTMPPISTYAAFLLQSYAPFNNFLSGPYLGYYLTITFDTYIW